MRQVRYSVAASLDGFIGGPHGEFDWIPMDPEIDFAAMVAEFGALVMGRRSYDAAKAMGEVSPFGLPTYVYSRTLPEGRAGNTSIVRDAVAHLRALKAEAAKDIWLWGGGDLFRSLSAAGVVDRVTVAVVPILLGGGLPLLPPPAPRVTLRLRSHRVYAATGIALMDYDVA